VAAATRLLHWVELEQQGGETAAVGWCSRTTVRAAVSCFGWKGTTTSPFLLVQPRDRRRRQRATETLYYLLIYNKVGVLLYSPPTDTNPQVRMLYDRSKRGVVRTMPAVMHALQQNFGW